MSRKKGRGFLLGWLGLWAVLFWCVWTPIPYSFVKMGGLLCVGLIWCGALILFPRIRWVFAGVALVMMGIGLWPAQKADSAKLRSAYVAAMLRYQNTPYVWGGENGRGIDCSGLMRRGMIDALLSQGWQAHNPALWREAATIWWRDCSANEMKNGYDGRIEHRLEARKLNDLDTSQLQPGDLAVMKSGVHVLAFVGGRSWIQADPNLVNGGDKVIVTRAPSRSGWFGQKVVVCRWKVLDGR